MNTNKILTWHYLLHFDYSKPLPNFRSKEILDKYNDLKIKENDIPKYIYNKYLINKKYNLVKNDFPYLTDNNVEHYVLWINQSYEKIITKEEIKNIIINKMKELQYDEYIFYENHESVKTIHEIKHYQIFFRKINIS